MIRFRAPRPVRVLLVEDNDVYAETLDLLLAPIPAVEVVGRACNGADGVALALSLRPEVVLMDVSMPVLDGFEATALIRSHLPATRVVMLTSSDDPADRARGRAAGAEGYLTKESGLADLLDAVTHDLRATPDDHRARPVARFAWA